MHGDMHACMEHDFMQVYIHSMLNVYILSLTFSHATVAIVAIANIFHYHESA